MLSERAREPYAVHPHTAGGQTKIHRVVPLEAHGRIPHPES